MGCVALEHRDAEGDLVFDALALGLRGAPELEVLRTVVGPVPIHVVDDLVVLQRPAELTCHDEAMLGDPPLPRAEPPVRACHGNVDVAVTDPSGPGDDPDRFVLAGVTVLEQTAVMGAAELAGIMAAVASP
jgi:hypothetical protein